MRLLLDTLTPDRSSRLSHPAAAAASTGAAQSEFARRAAKIGMGIHSTSQKLQKLAQLARRTSMFDDPAEEINELSTVVKQDIQVGGCGARAGGCSARPAAAHTANFIRLVPMSLPCPPAFLDTPRRRRSTKQSRTCRRFPAAGPTSSQQITRTPWWTTCAAGSKMPQKWVVMGCLEADSCIMCSICCRARRYLSLCVCLERRTLTSPPPAPPHPMPRSSRTC